MRGTNYDLEETTLKLYKDASVEIHVESDGETIVFSILEKNG